MAGGSASSTGQPGLEGATGGQHGLLKSDGEKGDPAE